MHILTVTGGLHHQLLSFRENLSFPFRSLSYFRSHLSLISNWDIIFRRIARRRSIKRIRRTKRKETVKRKRTNTEIKKNRVKGRIEKKSTKTRRKGMEIIESLRIQKRKELNSSQSLLIDRIIVQMACIILTSRILSLCRNWT